MRKPYFSYKINDPASLSDKVRRKIRFEEIDCLGIVWHGRYPSFFEDARTNLFDSYGIGYMDFYKNGILAPIKKIYIDYNRSLYFQEEITIEVILHWTEAAKINLEYIIRDSKENITTTGYTIQLMTDIKQNIFLYPPTFYLEFLEQWKSGKFTCNKFV
ncbi:MAG: acyl-CoA thioesterase [Desulfobacterales bacterium]|nr:acyl-CoA thioesterase [Desulfobacterales bacterium]